MQPRNDSRMSDAQLSFLLQELGEIMQHAGEDATQSDQTALISRLRSVLPVLLEEHLDTSSASETERVSILKLALLAVKRFPKVFVGSGVMNPVSTLSRCLALRLRMAMTFPVVSLTQELCQALLQMMGSRHPEVLKTLLSELEELMVTCASNVHGLPGSTGSNLTRHKCFHASLKQWNEAMNAHQEGKDTSCPSSWSLEVDLSDCAECERIFLACCSTLACSITGALVDDSFLDVKGLTTVVGSMMKSKKLEVQLACLEWIAGMYTSKVLDGPQLSHGVFLSGILTMTTQYGQCRDDDLRSAFASSFARCVDLTVNHVAPIYLRGYSEAVVGSTLYILNKVSDSELLLAFGKLLGKVINGSSGTLHVVVPLVRDAIKRQAQDFVEGLFESMDIGILFREEDLQDVEPAEKKQRLAVQNQSDLTVFSSQRNGQRMVEVLLRVLEPETEILPMEELLARAQSLGHFLRHLGNQHLLDQRVQRCIEHWLLWGVQSHCSKRSDITIALMRVLSHLDFQHAHLRSGVDRLLLASWSDKHLENCRLEGFKLLVKSNYIDRGINSLIIELLQRGSTAASPLLRSAACTLIPLLSAHLLNAGCMIPDEISLSLHSLLQDKSDMVKAYAICCALVSGAPDFTSVKSWCLAACDRLGCNSEPPFLMLISGECPKTLNLRDGMKTLMLDSQRLADMISHSFLLETIALYLVQGPQSSAAAAALATLGCLLFSGMKDLFCEAGPLLLDSLRMALSGPGKMGSVTPLVITAFLQPWVLRALFQDDSEKENCATPSQECVNDKKAENDDVDPLEVQLVQEIRLKLEAARNGTICNVAIQCLGALGGAAKSRQAFLLSSIVLIGQLDSKNSTSILSAADELKEIARARGTSAHELYCTSRPILEYVIKNIVIRPQLLGCFAKLVLEEEESQFMQVMIQMTLPILVEQQQTQVLTEIARRVSEIQGEQICVGRLLVQYGHFAIAEALMGSDTQEIDRLMQYMESVTGWGFISQLETCLPALLRQVIWRMGDESHAKSVEVRDRTHDMLTLVAQIITREADVPGLLKDHFVMLLNSLGDHFKSKKISGGEVLQVVRSLSMLVTCIEEKLVEFVPHVTALLTQATELSYSTSLKHKCSSTRQSTRLGVVGAWKTFLDALVQRSPITLPRVGPQALVALLPNFEENKELVEATSSALEFLIRPAAHNFEYIKAALRRLPPIPALPETEKITLAIDAERGNLTGHDKLKILEESLHHESLAVRHASLGEFIALLHAHKGWPSGLGSCFRPLSGRKEGTESNDVFLLENCISALLKCAGSEARSLLRYKVQLRAAKCLGMIGAVDPARVNITTRTPVLISISDEALALKLIEEHLARVLSGASDIDTLDAAAYAIQEILKAEPGSSAEVPICLSGRRTQQNAIWARLSESVKDIVRPCLTSNFTLQTKSSSESQTVPIFASRPLSFRRWILLWMRSLGANASGTRGLLFRACQGVFRHDMTTTLFLLPYIVHNVILHADENARVGIYEEFMAVLSGHLAGAASTTRETEGVLEVSTHEVFALVDALSTWVEENRSKSEEERVDDAYVAQLLKIIPAEQLAVAAFRVGAHARALKYSEEFLRNKTDNNGGLNPCAKFSNKFDDEGVQLLQQVYRGLEDPDSLAGLACLRESSEKVDDRLIIAESTGRWTEAMSLYERERQSESWLSITRNSDKHSSSSEQDQYRHNDGYLRCLLKMGHWSAVIAQANGLMRSMPSRKVHLAMRGAEAAWRLGQWDMLHSYVESSDSDGAAFCRFPEDIGTVIEGEGIRVGKLLQALHSQSREQFYEEIKRSRHEAMTYLSAASMDSYERAYPRLVWLQMVQESEEAFELHSRKARGEIADKHLLRSLSKWSERLSATQPSLAVREPILSLRRQLYSFLGLQEEAGHCILEYAKLCRKSAHFDAAFMAVSEAESKGVPSFELEQAKLLWDTGQSHHAISVLQRSLKKKPQAIGRQDAKMLLRLARWAHKTGQMQQDSIIRHYKEVIDLEKQWEKGYFYLARYLDELQADARRRQQDSPAVTATGGGNKKNSKETDPQGKHYLEYLTEVIRNYSYSLKYGHMHIFESLPRMLTLWYDFGAEISRSEGNLPSRERKVANEIMVVLQQCSNNLPVYVWLTALPQLTSHIAHINPNVQKITAHIIGKVLQSYPHQTLWALAAMTKSTVSQRKLNANEIIISAKKHAITSEEKKLYKQFIPLVDQLIKLCFHNVPRGQKTFSVTNDFGSLKRAMPLPIMMPLLKCLSVELPADRVVAEGERPLAPEASVKIEGVCDDVEVLLSLQRPKKLRLLGSDGNEYTFLCKPKDDLRKDARMMEFTSVLNRLLANNPQSRRRGLYIRTFGVIPLTEECGLIEWVYNTTGVRHVCQDIYTRQGLFDRRRTNPQIKKIYDSWQGGSPSDLLDTVLEMFPPRLHQWLLRMFPEPSAWYEARNNFTRTVAVWSMVGHVVGLGDRHGENILIDSSNGDCVHVDFSCLFDKGLALEKPEVVPFRLTQNMVDGFGISGVEGSFTRACEIALHVLRIHRNTLMSVLETFVHDPLVEWTKHNRSSSNLDRTDNALARRALATIQGRVDGVLLGVRSTPSLPLSIEGQVHSLIAEATNKDNLGRMYIWWMPWF